MQLPLLIAIFAVLFFGILAIYFSLKETKINQALKEKEKKYRHKLCETAILEEILENINNSLDIEKTINIIINNLDAFFPYSTASSLILKNDRLIFKTKIKEPVNTAFIKQVKDNMLKSMQSSQPLLAGEVGLPESIEEKINGVTLNGNNNSSPSSFLNIPLIVNEKIQGIFNMSSKKPHIYREEEMTFLYKISGLISHTLSYIQEIPIRENGKLISLITSLEDGVFMVDVNSQITAINKTAKDFLNIQKDNPTITQALTSLPNSYNFSGKIKEAITLNQKIEEKDIQNNNGKIFDITITPILDVLEKKELKAIGASFLIHDVTLEKSLSKMKDDFTNIIVHELRSPLTSIKASTEMLTEQNNLAEENKKSLISIINNQTTKMLEEVATILDASKLDNGLFTIQKTQGDLENTIEDTIESFRITAQKKSINLISHIDPFLPQVKFDSYHIRRCISNLLSNSFKFTPEGGTITVRAWLASKKIFVSVSDTGSGIPIEKQHLLFSKFTQIHNNTNGATGTGLGLYIAKGIIETHGGTISLKSEPNKDTTFTFNIPADITLQPPTTLPAGSPSIALAKEGFSPTS